MTDEQLLERISLNPELMAGKPVVKGTRLTVEYIVNLMAHGADLDEIVDEYQGLTRDDIRACLLFAARSLQDSAFMPLTLETQDQFVVVTETRVRFGQ